MSKKNQATPRREDNARLERLHVAIELSRKKWKLGFSDGRVKRARTRTIEAGDWERFVGEVSRAKERFRMGAEAEVWSCYEAGREGFWVHRALERMGIRSLVVDAASIEVRRGRKQAKTDRMDAERLARQLVRYCRGESDAWSVVRVPSREAEDARQMHREIEVLKEERKQHRVRIQSLLFTQGIDVKVDGKFLQRLEQLRCWDGKQILEQMRARLDREYQRLELVEAELRELEAMRRIQLRQGQSAAMKKVQQLTQLRGIGTQSAWVSTMEFFGWRQFRTRREVGGALGFTPTPYQSGDKSREQGISRAGNKRMRVMAIEMAWSWLRFQPDSGLSRWYRRRFGSGGKRMRKIGIVALARRLMIALWRYLESGLVPEGARLKVA